MNTAEKTARDQSGLAEAARILWAFHAVSEPLCPCDVIVGLGSYDPVVAEECAALLQAGFGKAIIFSGREGNWTAGKMERTEAEEFRRIALGKGVAAEKIILEKEATNIGGNITLSQEIIEARAWKSAIFVTKPQTMRRVRLTLDRHGRLEKSVVHAPDYAMEDFIRKFGPEQLFNEMAGDLDRIIKYPALGFQAATTVPDNVLQAFETLKQCGFTKHLLK